MSNRHRSRATVFERFRPQIHFYEINQRLNRCNEISIQRNGKAFITSCMKHLLTLILTQIFVLAASAHACGNEFHEDGYSSSYYVPEKVASIAYWPFILVGINVLMLVLTSPYWLYRCDIEKREFSLHSMKGKLSIVYSFCLMAASVGLAVIGSIMLMQLLDSLLSSKSPQIRLLPWGVAFLAFGICLSYARSGDFDSIKTSQLAQRFQWWQQFVLVPSAKCFLVILLLQQVASRVGAH